MTRSPPKQIKVLIVEDSAVVREMLAAVLNSDPELRVVGAVTDGAQALAAVQHFQPDVITMDIHMPEMDGFAATRQIMERDPAPIVIVSGSAKPKEVENTFRAVEAGAVAFLERPVGPGHPRFETETRELIRTVKAMAAVRVVRRWPRRMPEPQPRAEPKLSGFLGEIQVVVLGGSTGASIVLKSILSRLPADFPVPIVIVQHMAPGFIGGFAEWLGGASGFRVELARDGGALCRGRAFVAPDEAHLSVRADGTLRLSPGCDATEFCPSVAHLFQSAALAFGCRVAAALLSGMGVDGAKELKQLRDLGALTLAQDRESSVVFGMPGEAARLGAAEHLLPPEAIADALIEAVKKCPTT